MHAKNTIVSTSFLAHFRHLNPYSYVEAMHEMELYSAWKSFVWGLWGYHTVVSNGKSYTIKLTKLSFPPISSWKFSMMILLLLKPTLIKKVIQYLGMIWNQMTWYISGVFSSLWTTVGWPAYIPLLTIESFWRNHLCIMKGTNIFLFDCRVIYPDYLHQG